MDKKLLSAVAIIIGIYGDSNELFRSMSNIFGYDHRPWFVEYVRTDLKSKFAIELCIKFKLMFDCIAAFVKITYFFISDNYNAMWVLWKQLIDIADVDYTYECEAHPLNNLCKDLIRLPNFKSLLKMTLIVLKCSNKFKSLLKMALIVSKCI